MEKLEQRLFKIRESYSKVSLLGKSGLYFSYLANMVDLMSFWHIEWLTPLSSYISALGAYQVHWSTYMHRQCASIIPISQIVRSCHLIPKFGAKTNSQWTSETVLKQASTFFVNPDLRQHDFYLFCFLGPASHRP
ncbi:hypothetical protein C8J56DRAFT_941565 [Mycena floridula]|nr:hypothetical protein C8J56DRAFT_941565 [Mycena floridula]